MGAGQSTGNKPSGVKVAFNVLKVHQDSPASQAGLIPYFDHIISVNGVTVIQEMPNVVAEMAKSHVNKPMHMHVYNSRNDTLREVTIVPRSGWGGEGLLGCSIRYTAYERAIDRVWRILDTAPDSPGFKAGLVPLKDWIIGSVDLALTCEDDFYQLLIQNKKRPVRLIVFNADSDACREVAVVPDFEWGGDGCLGCDIGTGVLNRVPVDPRQVIANIAGNEKDSLLAGQGLLRADLRSPGKPVPVADIPDNYYDSPKVPLLPAAVPVPVQEPLYYSTPPAQPVPVVQEAIESPTLPAHSESPMHESITEGQATHPLFADAPAGEEDLFK